MVPEPLSDGSEGRPGAPPPQAASIKLELRINTLGLLNVLLRIFI